MLARSVGEESLSPLEYDEASMFGDGFPMGGLERVMDVCVYGCISMSV